MADRGICHFFISAMQIRSLVLTDFRNFAPLSLEFGDRVNIFYGDNGSGKTNLLEAIFVLCLGRSHRGVNDAVMVRDGTDTYRIEGAVDEGDEEHSVAVAYQTGGRKKITIDRVPIRIADLYERYCAVSAGPEDTEILSGAPSVRRTFLDVYLSQFSRKYLSHLVDYQRVLAQKNAALRNETTADPFNALLVPLGAAITLARAQFLAQIAPPAVNHYADISHGGKLRMIYKASISPETEGCDQEQLERNFEEKLHSYRQREEIMGTSLAGPHRDDIIFQIGDFPARTHASQGELRTGAIALKLAVYRLLAEHRQTRPLLLLDEIFAELDPGRTEGLVGAFGDFGQLFLTTAQEPPPQLRENSRSFKIRHGQVEGIE